MNQSSNGRKQASTVKIIAATVLIVGVIAWLAVTGVQSNKQYYVTIPEMQAMGAKSYTSSLRVQGFVKPSTIQADGTNVTFVLSEFESHNTKATAKPKTLLVRYIGAEPPPDTFKDDAQALAVGHFGRDGVFHATELQAKCASKYNAAPIAAPKPTASASPAVAPVKKS
jgi:cytochrome c-type biogenesis protein CcmE